MAFSRQNSPRNNANDNRRPTRRKMTYHRRKICRFCADSNLAINYKDSRMLRLFTTERGKIVPRRISGNCAKHQRILTVAIKQARNIAMLPFTTSIVR